MQDSFDIEETARFLYGGTALPMETLDALRAGLRVSAGYRSQSVTLADFERYHQVKAEALLWPRDFGPR